MVLAELLLLFASSDPVSALPDPTSLIQSAIAATNTQDSKGWKYTHSVERTDFKLDKNGLSAATHTKLYEVIMLEGEEYQKLLQVDGKPPDAKLQQKIAEDLERERLNRRRKTGAVGIKRSAAVGDLTDLERLYSNRVVSEETINGRKAFRVESAPVTGISNATKRDEELLSEHQTNWFDQEDGVLVQKQIVILKTINGMEPGTKFESKFQKLSGTWLLADQDFQTDMKVGLFHFRIRSHYHHFAYKRFTVESQVTG